MKTGLVLEGGAMRGMYTAGVMDIMMDHNIHFDGIIGVSAGALFGVNYLSGQRGRVIRYNKKYNGSKESSEAIISPFFILAIGLSSDIRVPVILCIFPTSPSDYNLKLHGNWCQVAICINNTECQCAGFNTYFAVLIALDDQSV